jgi:hypothetical protein
MRKLRPGAPSLNRFLIQGWETTNLTPQKGPVILSAGRLGDRSRKICGCFPVTTQAQHGILSGMTVNQPEPRMMEIPASKSR